MERHATFDPNVHVRRRRKDAAAVEEEGEDEAEVLAAETIAVASQGDATPPTRVTRCLAFPRCAFFEAGLVAVTAAATETRDATDDVMCGDGDGCSNHFLSSFVVSLGNVNSNRNQHK